MTRLARLKRGAKCMQDHCFGRWPTLDQHHDYESFVDTVFEITPSGETGYKCVARGFGQIDGGYGNGAIYLWGNADYIDFLDEDEPVNAEQRAKQLEQLLLEGQAEARDLLSRNKELEKLLADANRGAERNAWIARELTGKLKDLREQLDILMEAATHTRSWETIATWTQRIDQAVARVEKLQGKR